MSKSAIKSLNRANEILAVLGLSVGVPANWMTDEQARANFKNADLLACLIIDSTANALICENVDTLDDNLYDDMQQAVDGYIHANLDDWNQAQWKHHADLCDVVALLAKLAAAVNGQLAYNARQKDHAEALEVNEIVDRSVFQAIQHAYNDNLTHVSIQHAVDRVRGELIDLNRYPARFIVKMMISVRRLAGEAREQARKGYLEMMSRPASSVAGYEIPF